MDNLTSETLRAMAEEGERCNACGRLYLTVYRVPDDLWAKVTGRTDGGGTWCPTCFGFIASEKGYSLYWEATDADFPTALEHRSHADAMKGLEDKVEKLERRIVALRNYNTFLEREIDRTAAYLSVHGMAASDIVVVEGDRLRAAIAAQENIDGS